MGSGAVGGGLRAGLGRGQRVRGEDRRLLGVWALGSRPEWASCGGSPDGGS